MCFIAFGILSFDFAILRQALAVSITAWSFDFLINRKPVKFFLIVLLAACFHKTALIMLLIYPLLDKKIEKSRFVIKVIYYLISVSVAVIGGQIITQIYQRQDYSEYIVRGEGYNLLVFVYKKEDNQKTKTSRLSILHTIFVSKDRTADYQLTTSLNSILENNANKDDIIALFHDKNLPVDDILANSLADEILSNKPNIGYLTISNALQWRLQYGRIIEEAGNVNGISRLV